MYGVVDILTGGTGGPDFFSALIDDDWEIMDTGEARNAEWTGTSFQLDEYNAELNFIALMSESTEDVLLLAVNDTADYLDSGTDDYYIFFPYLSAYDYNVHLEAGYEGSQFTGHQEFLAISFYEMPPYTASLYQIEVE